MHAGQDAESPHICGDIFTPVKNCGDIVTMDHCSLHDGGRQRPLNGAAVALAARDMSSYVGPVCPSTSTSVDHSTMALRACIGDSPVQRLISDHEDELMLAARNLGAPHEAPQQAMPRTTCYHRKGSSGSASGNAYVVGCGGYARMRLVLRGPALSCISTVAFPIRLWASSRE